MRTGSFSHVFSIARLKELAQHRLVCPGLPCLQLLDTVSVGAAVTSGAVALLEVFAKDCLEGRRGVLGPLILRPFVRERAAFGSVAVA